MSSRGLAVRKENFMCCFAMTPLCKIGGGGDVGGTLLIAPVYLGERSWVIYTSDFLICRFCIVSEWYTTGGDYKFSLVIFFLCVFILCTYIIKIPPRSATLQPPCIMRNNFYLFI